ncbi:MAG: hypothetical protein H8D56_00115 [Planctomycetes bacterium]|nr:hypothetical protein [Planctomycetota bacterium]
MKTGGIYDDSAAICKFSYDRNLNKAHDVNSVANRYSDTFTYKRAMSRHARLWKVGHITKLVTCVCRSLRSLLL